MVGKVRRTSVCGMLAALAGTTLALGLTSAALGQQAPGAKPDAPAPGVPATPKPETPPDFVAPQPNRTAPAEGDKAAAAPKSRPAPSTPASGVDPEAPAYMVGAFVIRYALDHPSLPAIDDLLRAEVKLGRTDNGYVAPSEGIPTETLTIEDVSLMPPQRWSSRAVFAVSKAILSEMNKLGVIGVTVSPVEAEFGPPGEGDPDWGKDLRKPGNSAITLVIKTGLVSEMRTIGFGERIPFERRINAEEHARILKNAPVQVYAADDPDRLDVLRKDELDDYVFRLNRHPGRRVDLAVAAAQQEGGIALDLLINENKPWLAYAQVSNTGTKSTNEWRQRFGFTHNQVTGDDDIFSLDYATAGFDKSHAIVGSYERPIWGDWLRGKVFGSWNRFTASDVGIGGEEFTGEGYQFGGEIIANIFQHRELFVDAYAGARYQNVEVNNKAVNIQGEDNFFLPSVGLRLERSTETSSTNASIGLEWNLSSVAGTDAKEIEKLGRLDVDEDWTVLNFDVTHSFYLDPLLFGDSWRDTSPQGNATLAHELALSLRGQAAFGNRLIPNAEQVIGGLYTVRGYPESVVAGDTVVVGSAEYRLHVPQALGYDSNPGTLFGESFRYKPQSPYGRADWDLILRGFLDAGRTLNSNRKTFERDETLVGTGVGAEIVFKRNLSIRLDWGVALEGIRNEVKSGSNRFHFVATLMF